MKYKQIRKSEVPSSDLPKNTKLFSRLVWLVYFIATILAIGNLIGTNALATQGIVLDNILRETVKISKENQILSVEIGKINNLSYIESTAAKLGFRRVSSNLIISPVEAVAEATQR